MTQKPYVEYLINVFILWAVCSKDTSTFVKTFHARRHRTYTRQYLFLFSAVQLLARKRSVGGNYIWASTSVIDLCITWTIWLELVLYFYVLANKCSLFGFPQSNNQTNVNFNVALKASLAMAPSTTIAVKRFPGRKNFKKHISVLACADGNGSENFELVVIG